MQGQTRSSQDRYQQPYAPGAWPSGPEQPFGHRGQKDLHAGVERFMAGVFGWMALGLLVTAGVAMLPAIDGYVTVIRLFEAFPAVRWLFLLSPLLASFFVPSIIERGQTGQAAAAFFGYAALIGLALFWIPLVYSAVSIVAVFAIAGMMFAGMAAIGMFTKRDLSGMGRFLIMVLWGMMAAWLLSLFIPGMYWYIAAVGVPVFAGLTAWETQAIKQVYLKQGGRSNLAILGALILYSSFINLFLFLLRLFGGGRD